MRQRIGVLVAVGAVSLMAVQPATAKDKPPPPVRVNSDSTVTIAPGVSSATYSGTVTTKPRNKGSSTKERLRRRRAAEGCLGGRTVKVFHGTFLIGETETDEDGNWTLTGNKPPTGETIFVEIGAGSAKGARCPGFLVFTDAP